MRRRMTITIAIILLPLCLLMLPFLDIHPVFAIPQNINADIKWSYQKVDGVMKIYEPTAARPLTLWEMGNGKALADLPVSKEIASSRVQIPIGGKKQFVLVMKNDSAKTTYFFAAPHHMDPPEFSLGFKFKCLCVNHVFKIPPGEFWYRVVELHLDENYGGGEAITITHNLIGVAADRMQEEDSKPTGGPEHD